jgi:hypothetical protein
MKPEMLTPSELESLRQKAKVNNAYFKEAFADHSGMLTLAEREELIRKANENDDYAKKAFAHLRPKAKS